MSTLTITEFLEARITEDETVAKDRPADAHIHQTGCYYYDYSLDAGWFCDCDEDGSGSRRILAECAAKRAVIARFDKFYATRRANWMNPNYAGAMEELRFVLEALAAVYKDHPDYQQEWAL